MTPKQKAAILVEKYKAYAQAGTFRDEDALENNAKQCALILAEEIINSEPRYPSNVDWDDVGGTHQYYYEAQREEAEKYWQQVKKEIKDL